MNKTILVIYPHLPHYRSAIFKLLSLKFTTLFTSEEPNKKLNIKSIDKAELNISYMRYIRILFFKFECFNLDIKVYKSFSNIIILANPYILSTWLHAFIGRFIFSKNIIFWTHGFKRSDSIFSVLIKYVYFKIANHILVYDDYSVRRSSLFGFSNFYSVYNSLDYDDISNQRKNSIIRDSGFKYLISISRLEKKFEYEKAIRAIATVNRAKCLDINYIIIGDGPERTNLIDIAKDCDVKLKIYPSIYNNSDISPLIINSIGTIYPGIVGLSVIQSLNFGVMPIISNAKHQMPESESIVHGFNGYIYDYNNINDLVKCILLIYNSNFRYPLSNCISIIDEKYNPNYQISVIESILK